MTSASQAIPGRRRLGALAPTALPLLLICAYFIIAPSFDLAPSISSYDEKRLLQLGLLLTTTMLLVAASGARDAWLRALLRLPAYARRLMALVAVGGVVSSLRAINPQDGLLEVSHLTLLFCLTIAVAAAFENEPPVAQRLVAGAFTAAAALFLIDFGIRYAATLLVDPGAPIEAHEAFPHFLHVRFVGQWQTWTLPLVGLSRFYLPPRRRLLRLLVDLVTAGWWALVFVAGTRGTLVGQAAALGIVAWWVGRPAFTWLKVQLWAAACGLAAYTVGYLVLASDWSAFLSMTDHVGSLSDSGRLQLWASALAMIGEAPLLGVGPQHYALHADVIPAHPHNAVLQWAAEWGLPSALVISAVCAAGLVAWLRTVRRASSPASINTTCVAITASMLAGLVHSMLSGIIVMPLSQTTGALVVGWAFHVHMQNALHPSPATSGARLALVIALVSVTSVMIVCARPAGGMRRLEPELPIEEAAERADPRFWHRTANVIHDGD